MSTSHLTQPLTTQVFLYKPAFRALLPQAHALLLQKCEEDLSESLPTWTSYFDSHYFAQNRPTRLM